MITTPSARRLLALAMLWVIVPLSPSLAGVYKVEHLLWPGETVSIDPDAAVIARISEADGKLTLSLTISRDDAPEPLQARVSFVDGQRHQVVLLGGEDNNVLRVVEAVRRGEFLHVTARYGGFEPLLAAAGGAESAAAGQVDLPVYWTVRQPDVSSPAAMPEPQVAMEASDELLADAPAAPGGH